jgi:hypothetical protein
MASPVRTYSVPFLLVFAGALVAVFVEHLTYLTSFSKILYANLDVIKNVFNLDGNTTTALSGAMRDIVAIGAVALLCLVVSLTLFLIHAFSSDTNEATILGPVGRASNEADEA